MCVTANLIYSFLIWCTTQENGNVAQAKNNNFCQIWFRTFSCEFQQLQLYMLKLPWQPMKECLGSEMLLLTAWQLELRDVAAVTSVACICTLESNLWCKEQADSTECCKSKHQALTFLFCVLHFFSPQKFIHSTESTLGGVFLETENSLHVSKPNNQNAVVRPSEENPLHRVLNFSFPISSD